jgi:diguanylate cyclase (GGDEF)-like protein/PAS domain S-box-containing protein
MELSDRVLIVDAEVGAVEVVRQYLVEEGIDCEALYSPQEALDLLEWDRFSLLIMDLELPGISGLELVRRASALDPDLGILITTAAMDVSSAIEAMRLGAYDFLFKPFHISELAFAVEKSLQRRRLLMENRQYQLLLEERVREATAELRATKEYLENLLNSSVDTVLTIGPDYTVTYANRGAEDMLGYSADELVGQLITQVLPGGEEELGALAADLDRGPIRNHETILVARGGRSIPAMVSISRIRGEDGKMLLSTLAICRDITQQKQLESELKEMTIKDNLTNLYNQRHFYQRLETEIERAHRQGRPLSLMLFDVDRFKMYNDRFGHLAGDDVLRSIGELVRECTRDCVDSGFRYGGDEFTIILPETDEAKARLVAERIRASFEARRFDGCALSVGLITFHNDMTAQTFIRLADEMMYGAKRSGGNRIQVYGNGKGTVSFDRSEVV